MKHLIKENNMAFAITELEFYWEILEEEGIELAPIYYEKEEVE